MKKALGQFAGVVGLAAALLAGAPQQQRPVETTTADVRTVGEAGAPAAAPTQQQAPLQNRASGVLDQILMHVGYDRVRHRSHRPTRRYRRRFHRGY
ncbi:hypothetical protein F0P96_10560 [Hymenobacter busanensis]|uniref:Uncharacterized protein n=1 Tax=Hymenobacter busanensis TaxID=2607656 RepID=A0A7L4ZXF3_9BACT|nr:hypothetical protein [Hymenobacter busanensis]KAA9333402.1 hypothetical protein F0P96_10560 [Hymenobacter busanensis]QHJ07918.1 hypothetical protein GUY19_11745 [Hymenobacter busanensis]